MLRSRAPLLVSTLLVMALVAGIGVVLGIAFKHDGPRYPKAWDPRIAPLAAIAAKDRGLTFKHPVYVEFLANDAFNKQVTSNDDDVSTSTKQQVAQAEAQLRSLGFISGNVDLLQQSNQLNSAGILAFYSPTDKKIRVRGTTLTPAVDVTLVHELTHVLQDQYFDLAGTEKRLSESSTEDGWAYHALVEGDARRVEHEYLTSLPKATQDQIEKVDDARLTSAADATRSVPDYLVADGQAPYDLGEIAVTRAARGGNKAVDALFTNPPIHGIQLVQPWLLGELWTDRPFTHPTLPRGAKKLSASEFGAFYLYLMLSESIPPPQALTIADGWGGDQILSYVVDTFVCSKIGITGRDENTTTAIFNGLKTWTSGMPNEATVTRSGATVEVTTCDPTAAFIAPPPREIIAEELLSTRNAIEAGAEKDESTARSVCFANGVIQRFGIDVLKLNNEDKPTRAEVQELRQVAKGC